MSGPAIDQTADVRVDGVDVAAAAVDVVDEARDGLAVRSPPVNAYLAGVPQLAAVGVVSRQVHQEVGVVPFLYTRFANDPVIAIPAISITHL